jgi:Glycosyltransferase family 87
VSLEAVDAEIKDCKNRLLYKEMRLGGLTVSHESWSLETMPLRNLAIALFALLSILMLTKVHLQQSYGKWLLTSGTIATAGTPDFFAYWRAFHSFKQGLNPYNQALPTESEYPAGFRFPDTYHYWNPPWMLTLMAPVLSLPFDWAASLWMYVSISLVLLSGVLMWYAGKRQPGTLMWSVIATLCFYPLCETLYWGQTGALVTLGVAGFVWAAKTGRDFWGGAFLVLASLKPHVLYLLFLAVGFWSVIERRYRMLLSAAAVGASLCTVTWMLAPGVFWHWLENSSSSWEHISTRRSANLVGFIRGSLFDLTGSSPTWLVWGIPAFAGTCFIAWLAVRLRIDWERDLALILCCSVFTAPYGWMHDNLVLVLVQVSMVVLAFGSECSTKVRTMICFDWLAFQILVTGLSFSFKPAFQFFWFPLGIVLLWRRTSTRLAATCAA